ncbi:hypothetical protein AVEN_193105-1 [Araneus ventricosus]|uniref:Uncharacterized protein n=1 Tax=Araneus ventricosus TaxID=182803 RepID=A0A4Y2B2E4_ARAVE|nr:hypothetical protein AVEN_193105-1 [Araneus ventricosus]
MPAASGKGQIVHATLEASQVGTVRIFLTYHDEYFYWFHELSKDYVTSYVMKSLPVEKYKRQALKPRSVQLDLDLQASCDVELGLPYVLMSSGQSGFQAHARTGIQIFKMSGFMSMFARRKKFGCN